MVHVSSKEAWHVKKESLRYSLYILCSLGGGLLHCTDVRQIFTRKSKLYLKVNRTVVFGFHYGHESVQRIFYRYVSDVWMWGSHWYISSSWSSADISGCRTAFIFSIYRFTQVQTNSPDFTKQITPPHTLYTITTDKSLEGSEAWQLQV
jgi:hypothetical protein